MKPGPNREFNIYDAKILDKLHLATFYSEITG